MREQLVVHMLYQVADRGTHQRSADNQGGGGGMVEAEYIQEGSSEHTMIVVPGGGILEQG